jgi:hypothetical protein
MVRLTLVLVLACGPALACNYPDEGNMPVRRAVAKVRYLPETEAWAASMHEKGAIVHYALLLDAPLKTAHACYWPLEVRAGGTLWRRYYVTPDGQQVTRVPRVAKAPGGSTAGAR